METSRVKQEEESIKSNSKRRVRNQEERDVSMKGKVIYVDLIYLNHLQSFHFIICDNLEERKIDSRFVTCIYFLIYNNDLDIFI